MIKDIAEDDTCRTCLYIPRDVIEHSKNNPEIKSLSQWVNETYANQFFHGLAIKRKIAFYEQEILLLKEQLEQYLKEKTPEVFNAREAAWIKSDGLRRSQQYTLEGVYSYFVNTFNRTDVSIRQFKHFLRLAKEEKTKGGGC